MMRRFTLSINAPGRAAGDETFYWTGDPRTSTVVSSIGPSLGAFGTVPQLNIDLVRTAVAVYLADRSTPRRSGGSDWNQREIHLTVPVSDRGLWSQQERALARMLGFLSGDNWSFTFVEGTPPAETAAIPQQAQERIVLLSGGADSAVGAMRSRLSLRGNESHTLVSHYSASHIAPIQRSVAEQIEALVPRGLQEHEVVHFARSRKRADGTSYGQENTSRSRSFLFLSLGLAVASVSGAELWIPENGFASINPPLAPDRRGSLSTRTTHPAFLKDLSSLIADAGLGGTLRNPLDRLTKGEMFSQLAADIGASEASTFLSSTNSCSTTGQRNFGIPLRVHCGVCFGCVLRRAAFKAASLTDVTEYVDSTSNTALASWLNNSISVVPAVRAFAARGTRPRDLMALSLPHEFSLADALDLVSRGTAELAGYVE